MLSLLEINGNCCVLILTGIQEKELAQTIMLTTGSAVPFLKTLILVVERGYKPQLIGVRLNCVLLCITRSHL